jgi:hypothetical protein
MNSTSTGIMWTILGFTGAMIDAVDRHDMDAALRCFSVCGADKRAPYLERLAALFDLYDRPSKSHPAREAVLTFFSSCGVDERAPYLEQLAAVLDRDNIARDLAKGCSWRLIPTKKVLDFFSTCGADERAPYLEQVAAFLDDMAPYLDQLAGSVMLDEDLAPYAAAYVDQVAAFLKDKGLRKAAMTCLCSCSLREREPYMDRIAALLCDEYDSIREAALAFFSSCNVQERAPYMDRLAALLGDECENVREGALALLRTCTADERRPCMARIAAFLEAERFEVRIAAATSLFECAAGERAAYVGQLTDFVSEWQAWSHAYGLHVHARVRQQFPRCSSDKIDELEALPEYDISVRRKATVAQRPTPSSAEEGIWYMGHLMDYDKNVRQAAVSFFSTCSSDERILDLGRFVAFEEQIVDPYARKAVLDFFHKLEFSTGSADEHSVDLGQFVAFEKQIVGLDDRKAVLDFFHTLESERSFPTVQFRGRFGKHFGLVKEVARTYVTSFGPKERALYMGHVASLLGDDDLDRIAATAFFANCRAPESREPTPRLAALRVYGDDVRNAAVTLFDALEVPVLSADGGPRAERRGREGEGEEGRGMGKRRASSEPISGRILAL